MNLHGEGIFVFNVLADAVCIVSAGRFLRIRMSWKRVFFAALLGAFYALLSLYAALFSGLPGLLAASFLMSAVAFPCRDTLRGAGGIWLVGMGGSGMTQLLIRVRMPETAAVYLGLLFMLTFCLMGKKEMGVKRGVLRIIVENRICVLPAIVDTGNMLMWSEQKLWVIVVPEDMCRSVGLNWIDMERIAVCTASGEGTLPVFLPDECLWYPRPGKGIPLNAAVALAEASLPYALVPPGALQREWKGEQLCRITAQEEVSGPGCW